MLHKLTRLLVILSLLTPMGASPLGLGDIMLHSALNQPLDAKIDLTALGQTRGEEITVALASPAAFENAGLDRSLALVNLKFDVVMEEGGASYIRVSSTDSIKEPFLDFLVDIDWPSGHLLREYTLLLDPPVVLDEAPQPVQSVVAGDEPAVSAPETALRDEPVSTPGSSSGQMTSSAGLLTFGPVQRSDTLWSIASQMQQADPSATVEQAMMALLKNNPDAFYDGNINSLKAGYVLRVSDPTLLTAMSRAAAAAEVRRQNEQWMDSKQARAGMAGTAPQGMTEAASGGVAGASGGAAGPRLRLSVPDATATGMALEGVVGEGDSNASPQAEVTRLKNELAAALETSEASRQENTDLRERLAALQEQIDAMQRLTTLQDDTLAALQSGAGAPEAETGQSPASVTDAADTGKAAETAAARKPARKAEAPAKESAGGLLDDPNILAMGGVAALAVLVLVAVLMRRRRRAAILEELAEADRSGETQDEMNPPAWAAVAQAAPAAAPVVVQEQDVAVVEHPEAEDTGLDLMQADDDEIDVLAEADVYLAYRRFDKAEELIREAIKADPGRNDLILKLLEVQAASGNKSAFITQAESFKAMTGSGDSMLWDKVVVMGRRIAPEHVLFGGAATAAAAGVAQDAGDASLDMSNDLSALDLDTNIATGLDSLAAGGDEMHEMSANADDMSSLLDMDLALGDAAVSEASQDGLEGMVGEEIPMGSEPQNVESFGNASNVISFESRTGAGQSASDLPREDADNDSTGAMGIAGLDHDLDWLTGDDGDFGSLDGAEGDDFSSLISGEDEVGTKLDLAKAYIDMGDQESARNILGEVAQEGTQDQQREANDLMRQIG
ncbi:MAG: FimV family protein [Gammaproteobacteria bacterium]|nr:FimV family protein [Gammaproteobacteria bacterium]